MGLKIDFNNSQKGILRKLIKLLVIILLIIFFLIAALLLLIQTKPVQNFARKELVSYLGKKLKTKVVIDNLSIDFPKKIVLEGIYAEDRKKDTLIFAESLKVDISMTKLIFGKIQIYDIRTSSLKVKVLRQSPDTVFNYQFILDAFASDKPKDDTKEPLKMAVEHIWMEATHFTFIDYITGNEAVFNIQNFESYIDIFDPSKLNFDVPEISISGVKGYINQTSPLEIVTETKTSESDSDVKTTNFLKFANKHLKARNIQFDYSNEVSALATSFKCLKLDVYPELIDLGKYVISLHKIEMDQFTGVVTLKSDSDSDLITLTTSEGEVIAHKYLPWIVRAKELKLTDTKMKFDDNTKSKLPDGIDFGHLDINKLNFQGKNFYFHKDTLKVKIVEGNLIESSGFVLKALKADLLYTSQSVSAQNLFFQTPFSELKRNVHIRYPSIAAAVDNPLLFEFNMNIERSYVQVKDLLYFAPFLKDRPGFQNPDLVVNIHSKMTGNLKRLNFQYLNFNAFESTKADVSGIIGNVTDPDKLYMDLNIRNFSSTASDIMQIAPKGMIPGNIVIPQNLSLNGIVKGNIDSLHTNVKILTSQGNASMNGYVKNFNNPSSASYNAFITLDQIQPGAIFTQAKIIGMVNAAFNISGKGFDIKSAGLNFYGGVSSIEYKGYIYKDIVVNAKMNGYYFTGFGGIKDPNISIQFNGEGDLNTEFPCIIMEVTIDSIKTQPLNLTKQSLVYRGKILMDIPAFDPDKLNGSVMVTESFVVTEGKKMRLDTIIMNAVYSENIQNINLKSDFLSGNMEGTFQVVRLGEIFSNLLNPYYKFRKDTAIVALPVYDFTLDAQLTYHPTLKILVPQLMRMENVTLNSSFSDTNGWKGDLKAPFINYDGNILTNSIVNISADKAKLLFNTDIGKITIGENIVMLGTKLIAEVADQKVDFSVRIGDKENVDKYLFGGLVKEVDSGYHFSVNPDILMLDYENWTIHPENNIRYNHESVSVDNFDLSKDNQHLIIQSNGSGAGSNIEVTFREFRLNTLTDLVMTDTLRIDGTLNGLLVINNVTKRPTFTTDVNIKDLFIYKDTIGDIQFNISNTVPNIFNTNIELTGRGNDVKLTGNYHLKAENKANLDFDLDIDKIQMKTLEGASFGNLRNSKGHMGGKIHIGGSITSPDIYGNLEFFQTSMIIDKLNSEFKVDNGQLLAIDNTGLRFDRFTIKDERDNRFVIDGTAFTKNYINYSFDLRMRARDFKALNSTRADNQAYYGQIYFDTDMKIGGTEKAPVIDGRVRVNESTDLTIVIPQKEPGLVAREGVVVFVDKNNPDQENEIAGALDSLNNSPFVGMDVSINIEVDKKATLTLVIDEGNNDFIKMKGEAVLNGGIDKSGKVTLTGTYELDEGTYEMSFNLIDRSFKIQKGSKLTWTGEPTDATMNITAVYTANTTAVELVQDQIVEARTDLRYRQRLPFEVHLMMKGELLKPEISFAIKLPKESIVRIDSEIANQIEMRLNQLQAEPSELNKQVFSLLILNRFTSQNPFETAGGGFNPESMARQSVSKIMTEQLNNLASDLISGVDINFDIVSTEDFTSGKMQNKTDFNVGVSKRLFSERLNVTVGTNIALEGGQQNNAGSNFGASNVPNLNIEYLLSKDGQYLLRAYRRNQYEGIVEGFIVETGIGFVMSVDYDQFKDIFDRRKSNRESRRLQREEDQKNKPTEPPIDNNSDHKPNQNPDNVRKDEDEK
ncbi:MAG: translocation/assembly module TamB [Saprospiraceae bacterium]|nr:translocation/assembly module TamB [Saprospiraceae bacterium]